MIFVHLRLPSYQELEKSKKMEKVVLVHYEKNRDTSFYLCRHCQTHLALHQELLHKYETNQHALFRNLINVRLGENYQIVPGQTGAPVSCINCGSELGSKFVALKIETSAIKPGRFMIDLTKLVFWKGNQMLYADSEKPVQSA